MRWRVSFESFSSISSSNRWHLRRSWVGCAESPARECWEELFSRTSNGRDSNACSYDRSTSANQTENGWPINLDWRIHRFVNLCSIYMYTWMQNLHLGEAKWSLEAGNFYIPSAKHHRGYMVTTIIIVMMKIGLLLLILATMMMTKMTNNSNMFCWWPYSLWNRGL